MTNDLARGLKKGAEIIGYGLYGFAQGVAEGTYAVHAWPSAESRRTGGKSYIDEIGPSVPGHDENHKVESQFWGAEMGTLAAGAVEIGAYSFSLFWMDKLYILLPIATNAISYVWEKSRENTSAKKRGRRSRTSI
jgi:hypothetical protein